jgi:hypothetical protein
VYNTTVPFKTIQEELSHGLTFESPNLDFNYQFQRIKYGICDIIIPVKSIPILLINEILNPLYLFQVTQLIIILF